MVKTIINFLFSFSYMTRKLTKSCKNKFFLIIIPSFSHSLCTFPIVQELERLTQVAAAAFQSGTESVELLKKQVAAQRRELEDVKLNHGWVLPSSLWYSLPGLCNSIHVHFIVFFHMCKLAFLGFLQFSFLHLYLHVALINLMYVEGSIVRFLKVITHLYGS